MLYRWTCWVLLVFVCAVHSSLCGGSPPADFPDWLFPLDPSASTPVTWDSTQLLSNEHSKLHYTQAQLKDLFNAPDWFPESHDQMPEVVIHGRKPDVFACGFCHTPSGQGRPENASLAGLSASYIARQLEELRSGVRKQVGPVSYRPIGAMVALAAHLTDDQIRSAADYFSKQSLNHRVDIKESKNIPCVKPALWIYLKSTECKEEPLGARIIEIAPSGERHELRDDSMVYIAYVPIGSVARGRMLTHNSDSARACSTCHGENLRGTDLAPPLAGRSPSSLLRQLVAFQMRTRAGERSVLMQPVVDKMDMRDMIAAVAYAASLNP